ncbi:MAG: nicotinate-nucleotide diphosphorylase (carboxylating), partial [Nitrospirae bacterium]
VSKARAHAGEGTVIEVEVERIDEVEAAIAAGADCLLLDNMGVEELARAVALVAGRVPLEASGGITLETVGEVAATGVDFVSVGALTHAARAIDLTLELE